MNWPIDRLFHPLVGRGIRNALLTIRSHTSAGQPIRASYSREICQTGTQICGRRFLVVSPFAHSFISLYDLRVAIKPSSADQSPLLESLAEFRFELRKFLHFSEEAATAAGLQPQQHQLLLQVAGAREGTPVTIAYAADTTQAAPYQRGELMVNRSCAKDLCFAAPNVGLICGGYH